MIAGVILLLAVGCAAIKAVGPLVLHERPLPPAASGLVTRLAPALLVGLVLAGTIEGPSGLAVDARVAGVGVAALATIARLPMMAVLAIAVAVTALVRAIG